MRKILLFILIINSYCIAANRYWVGGTGNWSDITHWSASSGGAGGELAPTSADDVYFNALSFTAANQIVTLDVDGFCNNINWTGANTTYANPGFTIMSFTDLNIYGSLTYISGMTVTSTYAYYYFYSTAAGKTITSAGKNLNTVYTMGSGGSWALQDDLTTDYLNIFNGTFNSNNYTINASNDIYVSGGILNLESSTVNADYISIQSGSTANLNTSTINLNGSISSSFEIDISSLSTVSAGTSTINFLCTNNNLTDSPIEVYFGGKTLYNITFPSSSQLIRFYDGGAMNNLTLNKNNILILEGPYTYTINGTLTATGDCENFISIFSKLSGTPATITASSSDKNISYVAFKDVTETAGGNIINCTSCVSAGTNTNITFTTPFNAGVSRNLYWRGTGLGDGNWNVGSNWTTDVSGASSGNTCGPTAIDNVYFNAPSMDSPGLTITINSPMFFNNMDWTGVDQSPTFSNATGYPMFCTGDIVLNNSIGTFTNNARVYLNGTGNQNITSGGNTLNNENVLFYGSGTYYLEDDLTIGNVFLESGTLDVQNEATSTVYNLNILGDWNYLGGTWQPRSDNSKYVSFFGSAFSDIVNSTTFHNIKINKSSNTYTLTPGSSVTVTINNELNITTGEYDQYLSSNVTTIGNNVNITCAACSIDVSAGTFSYLNNSTTGFNFSQGRINISGGTFNIGVSGTHTTTALNVGNASGTGDALLRIAGGTLNIADQLRVKSDGILQVTSGTLNIKTNTTNGGTTATTKWQMDASSEFKQSGGTINLLGAADNNTTYPLSFNSSSVFTAGNITSGTVVLQSTTSTYDYSVDFGGKILYNLTINQASRNFTQVNAITIKNNFTITNGTYNANSNSMSVGGNWSNSGTFNHGNNTVTFNGTGAGTQTITKNPTETFYNLVTNTTKTVTQTTSTDILITNGLTMTAGNINGNGEMLTLGNNASATLSRTAGTYYGGTWRRWLTTGAISGNAGLAPVGALRSSTVYYRPVQLTSTSNVTTAGYIDISQNDATTVTEVSINDNGSTITRYADLNTVISVPGALAKYNSTSGLLAASFDLSILYNPLYGGTLTDLRLTKSTSPPGNHSVATGSFPSNLNLNRTGLTVAELVGTWFPGTINKSATPLPIVLLNFDARKQEKISLLNWQTSSEINNEKFEIQHSLDGENFKSIGEVKGNGTSISANKYEYIHLRPETGQNYYRLKQIDFDGLFFYSDVKLLNFLKESISVAPNPFTNFIYLNKNSSGYIINNLGQKVLEFNDSNQINTESLNTGLYHLILIKDSEQLTFKVVKE